MSLQTPHRTLLRGVVLLALIALPPRCEAVDGAIISVNPVPTTGGIGYSVNDILTVIPDGGSVVVTSVDGSGTVTGIALNAPGSGYTVGAGKSVIGGSGTGCTIEITEVETATATPTDTPSVTPTDTPTLTPTVTATSTPTSSPTATSTATPTPTPQPDGSDCVTGTQCESTLCVDGVCCDTPCSGALEQCNLSGREGTCTSTVAPAPTLTPWGLIAGTLLLAGIGAIMLRRSARRS